MTNLIIGGIAIALIVLPRLYSLIPFSSLWGKVKKISKKKEVSGEEFDLVVAVDKFEDLRQCLLVGGLDDAVEQLDAVFPLLNNRG